MGIDNYKIKGLEERMASLEKKSPIRTRKPPHPAETRATIASYFLVGYFALIFVVAVGVPLSNYFLFSNFDLNQLLLTVSGIVGTPLGFILGYYFKSTEK